MTDILERRFADICADARMVILMATTQYINSSFIFAGPLLLVPSSICDLRKCRWVVGANSLQFVMVSEKLVKRFDVSIELLNQRCVSFKSHSGVCGRRGVSRQAQDYSALRVQHEMTVLLIG